MVIVRTSAQSYAFALRNHDAGRCQGAGLSDAMVLAERRGFLPPAVETRQKFHSEVRRLYSTISKQR